MRILAKLMCLSASPRMIVCLFCVFLCSEFVVGYGMDFADQYRCMPFVGVLAPHAYGASEPVTQTNNSS